MKNKTLEQRIKELEEIANKQEITGLTNESHQADYYRAGLIQGSKHTAQEALEIINKLLDNLIN